MYMCVTFDLAKRLPPDGAYALIYVSQYCCCRFSLLPAIRMRLNWVFCLPFRDSTTPLIVFRVTFVLKITILSPSLHSSRSLTLTIEFEC